MEVGLPWLTARFYEVFVGGQPAGQGIQDGRPRIDRQCGRSDGA
jgi:hypothetical protein